MKFKIGANVKQTELKLTDMIEYLDGKNPVRLIFVKNDYDEYCAIDVATMQIICTEGSLAEHYDWYKYKEGFKHYKNIYLGVSDNE